MIAITVAIVVVGVALVAAVGIVGGFDGTSLIYFALIVALGAMAITVARKSRTGAVGPRRCVRCEGLISPNEPYCKHCGAAQ
jgi:hypothetical protein